MHAERMISRITSTSDSVYFNDAKALALKLAACEIARPLYIRLANKKYNTPSLCYLPTSTVTCVITYRGDSAIMRQLLNKARLPSPVYDIHYRFMRPSPLDEANK